MLTKVQKRDGRQVDFDASKIKKAILNSGPILIDTVFFFGLLLST